MPDKENPNTHRSQRLVYAMAEDFGRMGEVEAVFTAHPEDIAAIQGQKIYFGEILGKHSEIFLIVAEDTLKARAAPSIVVAWLEQNLGHGLRSAWTPFDSWSISGHNPLEFVNEDWIEGFLADRTR